jgi:hypothetical protein
VRVVSSKHRAGAKFFHSSITPKSHPFRPQKPTPYSRLGQHDKLSGVLSGDLGEGIAHFLLSVP